MDDKKVSDVLRVINSCKCVRCEKFSKCSCLKKSTVMKMTADLARVTARPGQLSDLGISMQNGWGSQQAEINSIFSKIDDSEHVNICAG